jgi:serine/threonine-protein kinase
MNDVCSLELLAKAVANRLTADEETALCEHLEQCDACCARMEQLAGGQEWQQEAATLLVKDDLDMEVLEASLWSEVDFSVDYLEPSNDANVLGQLGGYDVLAILGRGGMGVVLKAFDRELKRFVAMKALSPHLAHNSVARKRFSREAQAAAAVVNPHVIAIHHVQPTGRLPFLIMPLLTGETLAQRLKSRAPLELTEVLRIGMQIAVGLAAAHDQGLVHRDVKPANIFLEKGVERVVITDFGLARAADDVSMTRLGVVAGTPEYMSPEQAGGAALDGRSDLFSLGCVLYEMATGVSPFRSDSTIATLRRIVDEDPVAMTSLAPELPPWFGRIVERLLSKDPNQRFASASEVSQLLEQCLSHIQQPTSVPLPALLVAHTKVRRSSLNLTRKGMLIMLLIVAMGTFGVVLWQATEPPDISGKWTSDEWGTVVLKAKEHGLYEGTFTGDEEAKPVINEGSHSRAGVPDQVTNSLLNPVISPDTMKSGTLHLQWYATERRFKGTWGTGDAPKGRISLRLVDNEIRGACTTPADLQKDTSSTKLLDLLWKRSRENSNDLKAALETNPYRKLFESIAASPPNPSPIPAKLFKDCLLGETNDGTTDSADAKRLFLFRSIEQIHRIEFPNGMIVYEFTVDPLSFLQELSLLATGDKSLAEDLMIGMLNDPLGPRIDVRKMLRSLANRVKLTCHFYGDQEFDYMVEVALENEAIFLPEFRRFFESEADFLANKTRNLYIVSFPALGQSIKSRFFGATILNHRLYWGSLTLIEAVRDGRLNHSGVGP